MPITLNDAAKRLIEEGESALSSLDDVESNDCLKPSYAWEHLRVSQLRSRLIYYSPLFGGYDNLVEEVGYHHPQPPNAAASLVRKMLERYPELRGGNFTCGYDRSEHFERGYRTVIGFPIAPIDVLRVMIEYGWELTTAGMVDAVHYVVRTKDYARMPLVLLAGNRANPLVVLHRLMNDVEILGEGPLLWLIRYHERSANQILEKCVNLSTFVIECIPEGYANHMRFSALVLNASMRHQARRDALVTLSVMLCAEGGAWTFAFYKIQQFLY